MSTVLLILLAAALVYTIVQMKAGEEWARPATTVLAVVIILLAIVRWSCRGTPGSPPEDTAAVTSFEHTIAQTLADALGKQMPQGSQALVFALVAEPETYEAMTAGLAEGFKPYGITVAAVLPPIAPSQGNPGEQHKAYEAELAKHPEAAGVLIYGSPAADMEGLVPAGEKKLPLAIRAQRLTAAEAIQRVKEGTAHVVLVTRPDVNWPKVTRIKNPDRRFGKTYWLITPETAAEIEKEL